MYSSSIKLLGDYNSFIHKSAKVAFNYYFKFQVLLYNFISLFSATLKTSLSTVQIYSYSFKYYFFIQILFLYSNPICKFVKKEILFQAVFKVLRRNKRNTYVIFFGKNAWVNAFVSYLQIYFQVNASKNYIDIHESSRILVTINSLFYSATSNYKLYNHINF